MGKVYNIPPQISNPNPGSSGRALDSQKIAGISPLSYANTGWKKAPNNLKNPA
jgi:hypothetical protein